MKFTPELTFDGGLVRPLTADDVDNLFEIYQHPEIPGQRVIENREHLQRMIDLSVQMAATQRGMMWLLEVNGESQGLVSIYDWQPSLLRATLRVDGLPTLKDAYRAAAMNACMKFMADKYHLRNFAYQWIDGQQDSLKVVVESVGFKPAAVLRDAWRTAETSFANVVQYHCVLDRAKPVPRKLGDDDELGQNVSANGVAGRGSVGGDA
ncbi:GNAT family N-acetyltransferase [Thalassolituus sp.]|jgi:hypothetical protein|uniref:GNAT family N-acetyltransferase n=1 Tax=Thalassolituus sp. TaxID=2030822 RepID=UPI001B661485|nr:GNAT family N-acetyltransferase [Thalassolituus sp.]MBQ0781252.1 GNAT family N-acetyltransferase [Thalassolituus oleivorans]